MSRNFTRSLMVVACLAAGAVIARPVAAQHDHHDSSHHGGGHGSSHHGRSYHIDWGYVVPSHHHHTGLYYTYGGANYYTPVAPQVQVLRPRRSGSNSPTPRPLAEPIAPRSVKLEFGGVQQAEDLSGRLEIEANRWCLDMHHNYHHNPGFTATYNEAYKILLAAKYVHSAEHRQDIEAIRQEVAGLDPLFHHVQETISTWVRDEHRPVGVGDINRKAEVIEAILHHLMYDVGVEVEHGAASEEQAPPPAEEEAPPPARKPRIKE